MSKLEVKNHERHLEWIVLTQVTAIIGRDPVCRVMIKDEQASRRHAEIVWREDGYWIKDLGSTNGTIVNDKTVDYVQLKDDDRIRIGTHEIVFHEKSDEGEELAEPLDGTLKNVVATEDAQSPNVTVSIEPERNASSAKSEYAAKVDDILAETQDERDFCLALLDLAIKSTGAERACFILRRAAGPPRADYSLTRQGASDDIPIASTVIDKVFEKKESVVYSGPLGDAETVSEDSRAASNRSAMVAPLPFAQAPTGAVQVDAEPLVVFNADSLRQFTQLAEVFARAVDFNRVVRKHSQTQRLLGVNAVLQGMMRCMADILKIMKSGGRQVERGLQGESPDSIKTGWNKVREGRRKLDDLLREIGEVVGEKPPIFMVADINTLVGNAVDVLKNRAAECRIALEYKPDDALGEMELDPMGVYRAVKNLITNAVEATTESDDGRVSVRTELDTAANEARIIVEDNGPGIQADRQDKIFMLFNTSKRDGCLGLGLPVAQKTVKDHGGRIVVHSAPGEGTTFIIEMPIKKPKGE